MYASSSLFPLSPSSHHDTQTIKKVTYFLTTHSEHVCVGLVHAVYVSYVRMCSRRPAHLREAVDTVKAFAHEHVNATRESTAVFMVLSVQLTKRKEGAKTWAGRSRKNVKWAAAGSVRSSILSQTEDRVHVIWCHTHGGPCITIIPDFIKTSEALFLSFNNPGGPRDPAGAAGPTAAPLTQHSSHSASRPHQSSAQAVTTDQQTPKAVWQRIQSENRRCLEHIYYHKGTRDAYSSSTGGYV